MIFEFEGHLFVETPTKDLQVGDNVYHRNWLEQPDILRTILEARSHYVIKGNTGTRIQAIHGNQINVENHYDWSYTIFEEGWYVHVTALEYDPSQQGDTDDDL